MPTSRVELASWLLLAARRGEKNPPKTDPVSALSCVWYGGEGKLPFKCRAPAGPASWLSSSASMESKGALTFAAKSKGCLWDGLVSAVLKISTI